MSQAAKAVTDQTFQADVLESQSPCSWTTGRSGAVPAG